MATRFSPGEVLIGRYRIVSFHDSGGMQEVYRCHDITLDREVVMKTPKPGVVDRRFKRGAEMGARVNHPNIAATYDYYEDDSFTFLIEEFVPGFDLGKRLSNEFYYLDPYLAAHVIHHLAKALNEAHRVGICHRDLKPSNIMTSEDANISSIKLTDFGISKLAEKEIEEEMRRFGEDETTLTSSNTLLGAVPYMAPECWDDWSSAGQPMDVWALGCVAYHLLAGDPPFGVGRVAIMNVAKFEQGRFSISKPSWFGGNSSTSTLENELWELIVSCLKLNPEDRPSSNRLVEICEDFCYSVAERRLGFIQRYRVPYGGGGVSRSGFIDEFGTGRSYFFHVSEFFGSDRPEAGQKVSFSIYPGEPNPRSSPVLLLR